MNLKKNRELFLHWLLTISGGFMGAYSIIALGGNFTNAITGNMINFMRNLSGGDFFEFIIRVGVLFVFASGVMSNYLLSYYTKLHMQKAVLVVNACAVIVTYLLSNNIHPLLRIYPFFFSAAFQWGTFTGANGYNSSPLFMTNNLKQATLAFTQHLITKDKEFLKKGIFYSQNIFCFAIGAFIAASGYSLLGSKSTFLEFIILLIALLIIVVAPETENSDKKLEKANQK